MSVHPPPNPLREWTVAAGIIRDGDSVLMVRNRRKNGSCDWSTPGGVVEPGEEMVEALTREVHEETGLAVTNWTGPLYTVVAVAPAMGWHLTVEVYHGESYTGSINIDDPDKIVEEAVFLGATEAMAVLDGHSRWVAEPITDWLTQPWEGHRQYGYELSGIDRATISVQRHQ
jgi:8-oxo-dGTP diphosphatase